MCHAPSCRLQLTTLCSVSPDVLHHTLTHTRIKLKDLSCVSVDATNTQLNGQCRLVFGRCAQSYLPQVDCLVSCVSADAGVKPLPLGSMKPGKEGGGEREREGGRGGGREGGRGGGGEGGREGGGGGGVGAG